MTAAIVTAIGYVIGLAAAFAIVYGFDLNGFGAFAAGLLLPLAGAFAGMAVKR